MEPQTPEQELEDLINAAVAKAEEIGEAERSYENTVTVERLREAQMWNTRDIQVKEGDN